MSAPNFESSPLLQRIREKLSSLPAGSDMRLRVSVAAEPIWEKTDSGDEVLVRWACWTVESHGEEIAPPEFEVLSDRVTQEQLARELPSFFPDIDVIVDDEIDL